LATVYSRMIILLEAFLADPHATGPHTATPLNATLAAGYISRRPAGGEGYRMYSAGNSTHHPPQPHQWGHRCRWCLQDHCHPDVIFCRLRKLQTWSRFAVTALQHTCSANLNQSINQSINQTNNKQTTREHWIQRITFTAETNAVCSRYAIYAARRTHTQRDAERHNTFVR